jgi:hypothetical protein
VCVYSVCYLDFEDRTGKLCSTNKEMENLFRNSAKNITGRIILRDVGVRWGINLILKLVLKVRREGLGVISLTLYMVQRRVPTNAMMEFRCPYSSGISWPSE